MNQKTVTNISQSIFLRFPCLSKVCAKITGILEIEKILGMYSVKNVLEVLCTIYFEVQGQSVRCKV